MSNAEIAERLLSLAQLLSAKKENPFKVKAYRRAARTIKALGPSVEELVRQESDLTTLPGIGKGIGAAISEIVLSGTSRQLQILRAEVSPEIAAISEYPRLDPGRVLRIYKKLRISSIDELKAKLTAGEISAQLGARMDQHVRQALTDQHEILLYDAHEIAAAVEEFLLTQCHAARTEAAGDYRRRIEVLSELSFLIETSDFPQAIACLQTFGGGTELLNDDPQTALFRLASGIFLRIENVPAKRWGIALLLATGSPAHLEKLNIRTLAKSRAACADEPAAYRKLGLCFIEPELREGLNEVDLARHNALPLLIAESDIRGELHAHSTSSDGSHSIEQMASAAAAKGYEYTGITDHSQSLKIAGGVSEADLWKQLRFIDKLNSKQRRVRILKSAEVDILADGALDYSNDLLKELDYTVCSIHSRFAMDKAAQTERLLRAMDNPYFNIVGHATGRMLLKRPGYEIDIDRVVAHAKQNGCFFEINSSPDRLDLSAAHARIVKEAGVKIAINTDAHSMREYGLIYCGIEQARRAGLDRDAVLNTRPWDELQKLLKR